MGKTISKAEVKLASSWLDNIYATIQNTNKTASDLKTLLEKYSNHNGGKGKMMLAHAFNTIEVNDRSMGIPGEKFLLLLLVDLARTHESPETRKKYRECIALVLNHGAEVTVAKHFALRTILMGVPQDASTVWAVYEYVEILRVFLDNSNLIEYKTHENATVAHLCSDLPVAAMKLIIERKPELINAQNIFGTTPIIFSILPNKVDVALTQLLHPIFDINLRNKSGATALSFAILYGCVQIAKSLLAKGANIEPTNTIDMHANFNTPPNLVDLAKAGYFLCDRTSGMPKNVPLPKFNGNLKRFFVLIANECLEYISTPEEMANSKISAIEPRESRRLHQSFKEIIFAFPNDSEIKALYDAFSLKHPLNDELIIDTRTFEREDTGISSQGVLRLLRSFDRGEGHTVDMEPARAMLSSSLNEEVSALSTSELKDTISGIGSILMESREEIEGGKKVSVGFAKLMRSISLRIAKVVVLPFVEKASAEEIESIFNSIQLLLISATAHSLEEKNKSSLKVLAVIDILANMYREKNVLPFSLHQIDTLSSVNRLVFYAESAFLPELAAEFKCLQQNLMSFRRTNLNTVYFIMIIFSVVFECINTIKVTQSDLKEICTFLDELNEFLTNLYGEFDLFRSSVDKAREHLPRLTKNVALEYKNLANQHVSSEDSMYHLADSSDKQLAIVIPALDSKEISASELRGKMKLIPNISWSQGKYFLNFYGISTASVLVTVEKLNALKKEDLLAKSLAQPTESEAKKADDGSTSFVIATTSAIKQIVPKQKNSVSSSPPALKLEVSKEAKLAQAIAEIRIALNLPDEVDIFAIYHPAMPKSRKDHCFGIWGEVTGAITPQALEIHRTLAMTGKVTTRALNQAGLKPAKVMVGGEIVEGLKTKRPTEDERINAGSLKLPLQNGNSVLLFVFGQVSNHKMKTITTVDPKRILNELKIK